MELLGWWIGPFKGIYRHGITKRKIKTEEINPLPKWDSNP
jgi:hypothetical protein